MDFYTFQICTPQGEILKTEEFKGKVVLIVNTATKCGLAPQLQKLEIIHQKYKEKGLVVLGFPCNQFGRQEPETNDSIEKSCKIKFGVTFQLTEKIEVNGDHTHPIYVFIKNQLSGFFGEKIRWNFTKFLIDRNGKPIKRYAPTTKPEKLIEDIKRLL